MVSVLARYAARYSVRANDVTVDATLLWVGVVLAVAAAVLLAFVPRLPSADSAQRAGAVERQRADHHRHEPAAAACSRSRRSPRRSCCSPARACSSPRCSRCSGSRRGFRGNVLAVNVPVVSYTRKPEAVTAFYKEAIRRISAAAGRRAGGARHRRAVARSRLLRGAVHRRGLSQGQRRRGSARAVPHGVAGILFRAGRPADRRPRLQRRRSARRRARRDRQPEPGAAHVPEHGRGQPPADVDRSGHQVHRRQQRSPPHRRHRARHRRRERRADADDDRSITRWSRR